ncbi:V-type ATP synthase subunit C [subsurface metagenome]
MIKGTPYSAIVSETEAKFMATSSTFPVEIALDHYFYKQLLSETERLNSRDYEIAQRMIGVEIDMQNINWIIRFKSSYNLPLEDVLQYIIPRGYMIDRETAASAYASQNVADLLSTLIKKRYSALQTMLTAQGKESYARLVLIERILEQIMLYEVRHVLAGYPFTIGIMLAYFILKRNEIKKIMTILNAKYYRIAEERIKSVL